MNRILIIISCLLISVINLKAEELFEHLPDSEQLYILTLKNGDIISGYVVELTSDPDEGEGFKFSTELGTATIWNHQVDEIKIQHDFYRHSHRIFLLPTAEPIGDNHFIGNFELLMFYAGVGIYDIVSITAGHSFLPGINSNQQVSVANVKATLMQMPLGAPARELSFAVGANLGFINHDNRIIHYYGVGTLALNRTSISGSVFVKGGSADNNILRFGNNSINMDYHDGSFGLAIGLDTRFSDMHNLHFIGELWNSDVTKPTNSAVMLGLRLCGDNFSSDFGLAFFTQPFVAPFCSFVWTPF